MAIKQKKTKSKGKPVKSKSTGSKTKKEKGKASKKIGAKVKDIASGLSKQYLGSDILSKKSSGLGKKRKTMRYTNVKALNRSSKRLTGFIKTFKKHASSLGYKVERKTRVEKK